CTLFSRGHVTHEARGQGPRGLAGVAGLLRADVSRLLPGSVGVAIRPDPLGSLRFVSFVTGKGYLRRARLKTFDGLNEFCSDHRPKGRSNHRREPRLGPGPRGLPRETRVRPHRHGEEWA